MFMTMPFFSLKCYLLFSLVFFSIPQCILFHPAVADCAVVGQEDALKGHVPFALCVLRQGESSLVTDITNTCKSFRKDKAFYLLH